MELNKQQVRQLHQGIFIRKKFTIIDQQQTYIFELDVQDLKIIEFQCDFTGSENITIKGRSSMQRILETTVQPRQKRIVAQVELHQGWKLKTTFRFRRRPILKQKQLQYIHSQITVLQSQKTMVETVLKKIDVTLTPIQDINKILQKSKIKFIDSQFPPIDESIVGQSDRNLIDQTVNHWRRFSDIYKDQFSLIARMNHIHLVRGKLADNSFFSVVVCLAHFNQALLERLFFGVKKVNPNGIYRLRLCKNGQWQSVTIDDLVPCQPLANPKFASSTANQIWINLLQKAYAKVHGCYLHLHDLQVSSVFADLTGCPTQIIKLSNSKIKNIIQDAVKNKLIIAFYDIQQKQFDEDEFTPLKNYAYALLSIGQQDGQNKYTLLSHNHQPQSLWQDQLFKKFRYACICHARNWQQVRIKGKFITAQAGTQQNQHPISMSRWYYSLDLPQASDVHICIHQQDMLINSNQHFKPYIYCSFLLLQKSQKSQLITKDLPLFTHNRQVQLKIHLQAGTYLIIPFINSQAAIKKPPNQEEQIVDVFRKLDLLMRRQLKYAELVPFFKVCGQVFDQEIFNQLLKSFGRGRRGIGLLAFRQMWAKNRIYWKDALSYYQKQRLFTLSVHSNIETNILIKNNIGTQYNNRAHCQIILKTGHDLPISKNYQKYAGIKYLKSKSNIVEYMVQNKHDRKIQVELECQESKGYMFIPKSGRIKLVLDSGQKQFLMKLIPYEKSQVKDLEKIEKVKVKTFE